MFGKILWRAMVPACVLSLNSVMCKEKKREIYIWGGGSYQARPDALLQFKNFIPKKIEGLPQNLVELVFGHYYEGGIDKDSKFYIWQKHSPDANVDQQNRDSKRQQIRMLQKNVKSAKFTQGYIWVLTKDEKVYQYPITKKFSQTGELIEKKLGNQREVVPLRGTVQLQTGRDHVVALSSKGEVFAMGDDTYGQCGQADTDRNTSPPFTQKRVTYPMRVKNISEIVKISTGSDHNLALDRLGNLYGWGSNSNMQLSHEQQFSKMNNPLICTYTPLRLSKGLDYSTVKNVVAGDQFTIIMTQNRQTNSAQVFSVGTNLKGQLGINQIRHIKDISKIDKLSNYVMKTEGTQKKVEIQQIQCGKNHCIALLNIGYIMQWGDNQYGQMGNKKRSTCTSPIVLKNFMNKKILGVFASQNNSAVILEEEQ